MHTLASKSSAARKSAAIENGVSSKWLLPEARTLAEMALRWVAKGHFRVGSGNKEFEVKPTGKGKVVVTITSTSPIPDQKSTIPKVPVRR